MLLFALCRLSVAVAAMPERKDNLVDHIYHELIKLWWTNPTLKWVPWWALHSHMPSECANIFWMRPEFNIKTNSSKVLIIGIWCIENCQQINKRNNSNTNAEKWMRVIIMNMCLAWKTSNKLNGKRKRFYLVMKTNMINMQVDWMSFMYNGSCWRIRYAFYMEIPNEQTQLQRNFVGGGGMAVAAKTDRIQKKKNRTVTVCMHSCRSNNC